MGDYTCDCSTCNGCDAPTPKCSDGVFGLNFCSEWCNTPTVWGCGVSSLPGASPHNTDNLDYTCDCSTCNGCDEQQLVTGPVTGTSRRLLGRSTDPEPETPDNNFISPDDEVRQCTDNSFLGINFCSEYCNTPGRWGCGVGTLPGIAPRNTANVDFSCECGTCNGCDGGLRQCTDDSFLGLNFCSEWCNKPGRWGCGVGLLPAFAPRNTANVDFSCDCGRCGGCGVPRGGEICRCRDRYVDITDQTKRGFGRCSDLGFGCRPLRSVGQCKRAAAQLNIEHGGTQEHRLKN